MPRPWPARSAVPVPGRGLRSSRGAPPGTRRGHRCQLRPWEQRLLAPRAAGGGLLLVDGQDMVALDDGPAVDEQQLQRRRPSRAPARPPGRRCRRAAASPAATARRRRACPAPASRSRLPGPAPWRRPWSPSPAPAARPSPAGPPTALATRVAARTSPSSELASFEAAPSTPSPTGTPASSRSRDRQMPAPSRALEDGQCATPVPVAAEPGDRLVVQVDGVGQPHVAAQPAERVQVLDRRAAEMLGAVVVLIRGLGQVGVQPDPACAGPGRRRR